MPKSWDDFETIIKSMNTEEDFNRIKIGSDFSAKLIKARLNMNLTQSELACRAGLKQSAIARIENQGSLPRLDTVYKIADALNSEFDFYPRDYTQENLVPQDIVNKIENLENNMEKLVKHVKLLTEAVNKKNKQHIILHVDSHQQSNIRNLTDLQKALKRGFEKDVYSRRPEILKRGVEMWGVCQQYS